MVRTQIYLTEKEYAALRNLSPFLRKSQSEVIRIAIDDFVARHDNERKKSLLLEAAGAWKDSDFDLKKTRSSWNRSF